MSYSHFRKGVFFVTLLVGSCLAFSRLSSSSKKPFPHPIQATAEAQNTDQPTESIVPAESDRQMAKQFRALIIELDKPPSLGREMVNNTRGRDVEGYLQALESKEPVSTRTLAKARRYTLNMMPRLAELTNLTVPEPAYITERRGKLTIDGKLDEPTWKRAAEVPIHYQFLEPISERKATARLLWDSKFLYVGFEVQDTNIIAPSIERDGDVWKTDCVEIFLMPSQRFGTYWEIEMSPTGSILDFLCYKYSSQWGSDLHTTETVQGLQIGRTIRGTANDAKDTDQGYTIEAAIPFDQLPGMQKGGAKNDQFYALLGWVNNDAGTGYNSTTSLAQVPFVGWFHNVWAYQPFTLVTKLPKPAKVKQPAKPKVP